MEDKTRLLVILNIIFSILVVLFVSCEKQENKGIKDIDGNFYDTVRIGTQVWMTENLKTTKYADGTPIPFVNSKDTWNLLGNIGKAYCWYNNDVGNKDIYGALYTWAAATNGASNSNTILSNVQGVCPTGWHLPSEAEWTELETYLGGDKIAGAKLKEAGNAHWYDNSAGVTNETGFTGLPGGNCNNNGSYQNLHIIGYYWSSSESNVDPVNAGMIMSFLNQTNNSYITLKIKLWGASVRCIMD
jgi:uncharacterized protein (TIGR02145 family)